VSAGSEFRRGFARWIDALPAGVVFALALGTTAVVGMTDELTGPDVNLTSRIERLCRELDRVLIMSEAFVEHLDRPVWEIGAFELRGFHKMQRLFELPPDG